MKPAPLLLMIPLAAALSFASCTSHDPKGAAEPSVTPEPPLAVERSVSVHVTARVKQVDISNRLITLQDAEGDEMTYLVSPSVRRLDEVRVGDNVSLTYTAAVLAERRAATPDEAAHPIAVIGSGTQSREGGNPVGSRAQAVRVVTTIDAVDARSMLITLRGPLGDTFTVTGRNPDNVARLRVGDTVVITFTETLAVGLEKIGN
jgi:hypothetical protein